MISWLKLPYQVTSVNVNEIPYDNELPVDLAVRLAVEKSRSVKVSDTNVYILGADTIVDYNQNALGKPVDAIQAVEMLRELRTGVHHVHTGIALLHSVSDRLEVRRVTTDVWMRHYTDAEIDAYISSGDPMDKAGAYAVQHTGFHPVQRLDRCYANVVGLPFCALVEMLKDTHYILDYDIPALCLEHFNYRCPKADKGTQVWLNA
jgi:MAF protein